MSLVIRGATAEDFPAVAAMFTALSRYENTISNDRRTDEAGGEAAMRGALEEVERSAGYPLVATVDDHIIGFLFLAFRTDHAFIRPDLQPHAYVTDMFVAETHRRQGIGTALLQEAERLAAKKGVPRIGIGVLVGNTKTEALYQRAGYTPYATEMIKPLKNNP
jgi:GNAT superfamily N-acetyltransferase